MIIAKRKELYETKKAAHPDRWSGPTRNWEVAGLVELNPENEATPEPKKEVA
ncbi:MAG: putative transposase [Granulosicoccus sp.]|jgi:putative transposase